jgi:4-amino-4-deoxy-L-arabinose transferase-like glycosyltransferase
MFLIDLMGAALTLIAIGFLALGGYLGALRLLRGEAVRDPLALAIAALLLSTVEAVAIGLLLGGLGLLRIDLALALQALLVLALLVGFRKSPPPGGIGAPARELCRRSWAVLRRHPVLSLLTLHAVGNEAIRGLLRPPLSWDSLMYHLLLAGTWLRDHNLDPVFGNIPNNYYGYVPANGSVWFWWWMAPSHSEFWVNLASLPHWALVGLAAGGIARRLGAGRYWPYAGFLMLLTPTVVRFAAAEYVDLFVGAALLSAVFFILHWLEEEGWGWAVLAGAGMGLAAGAKVLGIFYAVFLAAAAVPLARGRWGRRVPQIVAAFVVAALLGSFFYLRNVAWGSDPLALTCLKTAAGPGNDGGSSMPRRNSVLDLWRPMIEKDWLIDTFLGITKPAELELGVGPQVFVLLLAALFLPFGLGRERRRESLLAGSQVWAELAFWLAVPYANNMNVFANVRYLMPALGLAFAGGVTLAERRRVSDRWMDGLAVAFLAQGFLQLHAEMPHGERLAIAVVDLAAVALALSPALRSFILRRWRELAAAALLLALLGAPFLADFRVRDRDRALAQDLQVHMTSARLFAGGWRWLDRHGGDGAVASVHSPNNYFQYPAMGPRLERDARYVNVNAADRSKAFEYPECQPRVDFDPRAWVVNLAKRRIRWVHLSRYPQFDFSIERRWADSLPNLFALRYEDPTNRVYEFLPDSPAEPASGVPSAAARPGS